MQPLSMTKLKPTCSHVAPRAKGKHNKQVHCLTNVFSILRSDQTWGVIKPHLHAWKCAFTVAVVMTKNKPKCSPCRSTPLCCPHTLHAASHMHSTLPSCYWFMISFIVEARTTCHSLLLMRVFSNTGHFLRFHISVTICRSVLIL